MKNDNFYMADAFDRGATMNWMAEDYDSVSALSCCANTTAATYKDISTVIEGVSAQGTSSDCYGYTLNNLSVKEDSGNWTTISFDSIESRIGVLEEIIKSLFNKNKKYGFAGSRWGSDLRSRLLTLGGGV